MQDQIVFDDMVARIRATNQFRWVHWGPFDQAIPGEGAILHIQRLNFNRDERFDSMDTEERKVTYVAELTYYNPDHDARKKRILNLEGVLVNVLHHKRIGGITMPMRTTFQKGRDDLGQPAGVSKTIYEGVFTYKVPQIDALETGE